MEIIEIIRRSTVTLLYGPESSPRVAYMEFEAGLHGALLSMIDPAQMVRTRVEAVAKAYRLAPAEVRVAILLAGGMVTARISESRLPGSETVKSQIANTFAMLQCSTRAAYT